MPALPHISIPAVPAMKPPMEKQITLLAGNLEADVTETLSRGDGLLTFAADDDCSEFHRSPPQLCLLFLVRELFFPHGTCPLLLPPRSLLAKARTTSKRAPRNFSNSSLERNRSSVQESTSCTQPSNRPSVGLVSFPSWTTNAPRIRVRVGEQRSEGVTWR